MSSNGEVPMPILDEAERLVAERTNQIAEALTETDAEVFYDEDGDEGWHITIGAGHEHYRAEGGTSRESVLTYWTRDDTWYWETLGAGSKHTGPWPLRVGTPEYLDGTSEAAQVVERVLANVTCDDPECQSDQVEPNPSGGTR